MSSLIPNWWSRSPASENEPVTSLQREVNRIFEDFGRWPAMFPMFRGEQMPRITLSETDSALMLEAELPGLDEKEIDIALREDLLTIRGERKQEREEKKTNYHIQERSFGSFARTIALPFAPDAQTVKAAFDKGVLKITLPKPAEVTEKTVKIPVVRT